MKMRVLPNLIALILVSVILILVIYMAPKSIVECEWRNEQTANEKDKSTSYELKNLREDFVGRAQRAFKNAPHSRVEIATFLVQYNQKVKPLYAVLLAENKFTDVAENAETEVHYNNAMMLVVAFGLTIGYQNIEMNSIMGKALLVVFSYITTVLLAIIIGAMCQFNNGLLRWVAGKILQIDDAKRNPNKMCYKYMWDVVKREGIQLGMTAALAIGAIIAGAAIMKNDQKDWTWSMAIIYAQAAAFSSGHTKYIPDPIEANQLTVKYVLFLLALHVWMITFVTMFLASAISFIRSIYNTQWAELSEEEFYALKEKIESRKRQRQLDNPKYEE